MQRNDDTTKINRAGSTAGGEDDDDGVTIDFDDITYTNVTISNARFVAYYVDTGTPGTSPIMNIIDFGSTESRTAEDLVLQINASGNFDLS